MPDINIGQQGTLKSKPKLTRINGDDHNKVIYRNMGNNHAYPFIWASTITVASGTSETLIASGIKWHGYELASYASVVATPEGDLGTFYIDKDTNANTITFKCSTTATASTDVAVMCMLGGDMEIEGFYCRGNNGVTPSLP